MAKETAVEKPILDVVFMLKNTLFCFGATILLLFLCAVASVYLSAAEPVTELLVMVVTGACVLWGGFRAAGHTGRQGLLQGVLCGLIYAVLLFIAGFVATGEIALPSSLLISAVMMVGCGAIGGVLGVNTKTKKKRTQDSINKIA